MSSFVNSELEKSSLRSDAHFLYSGRESITKEEFFRVWWDTLTSFVHHHKTNPLLKQAVQHYQDLSPRLFTILAVLYGSFTYEPTRFDLLSAAINLLDRDLIEEELSASTYANDCAQLDTYYPVAALVLQKIHDVYGRPEFAAQDLPPSPYLGFAFLALNHQHLFSSVLIDEDAIAHALHESHLSMLGMYQRIGKTPRP